MLCHLFKTKFLPKKVLHQASHQADHFHLLRYNYHNTCFSINDVCHGKIKYTIFICLILIFQKEYASFWVEARAESVSNRTVLAKYENRSESIIFENCYPYDLTRLQKYDFENIKNFETLFVRHSPDSDPDLDEDSLKKRLISSFL